MEATVVKKTMSEVAPDVVEFEGEKMLIVRASVVETTPWKKGRKD